MPNSADSGAAGSRLAMARGPSWPLRTPLQPASGWPSHCTILAKHGGIASTLRTLLTSPLGLVRCPGPKTPTQRGCFFAAMQRRAARVRASVAVWNFARSASTSAILGVGVSGRPRCTIEAALHFEKRPDRFGRGLGSKRDCDGAATVRIHNSAAPTQGMRRFLAPEAKIGVGICAERKPAFRQTGPIN